MRQRRAAGPDVPRGARTQPRRSPPAHRVHLTPNSAPAAADAAPEIIDSAVGQVNTAVNDAIEGSVDAQALSDALAQANGDELIDGETLRTLASTSEAAAGNASSNGTTAHAATNTGPFTILDAWATELCLNARGTNEIGDCRWEAAPSVEATVGAYGDVVITPLGSELRELAQQLTRQASQAADVEQVQALRRELGRKLAESGDTVNQIAQAAGVPRFAILVWMGQTLVGGGALPVTEKRRE